MDFDVNATSATIMPHVEELPYHGDNPNQIRRIRLEGGDLAPEWARSLTQRGLKGDRVDGAWCVLSVWPDGLIGAYGGTVWPSAWPELFQALPASAQAGSGGFKLTTLGFKLLGMRVTWTQEHADYLERQISRLMREEDATESEAAKTVFHQCRVALINLRRPIGGAL